MTLYIWKKAVKNQYIDKIFSKKNFFDFFKKNLEIPVYMMYNGKAVTCHTMKREVASLLGFSVENVRFMKLGDRVIVHKKT